MNKFLITIILIAFLIVSNNFCNAAMSRNEMFLGGLTFGSSSDEMLEIYGLPDTNERGVEFLSTCTYGSGVNIGYRADVKKIFKIVVKENNGWKTPAGLAVGMKIDKAFKMYGRPDFEKFGENKIACAYFHYNENLRDFGFIIFADRSTGKILEMRLEGDNSMALFDDFFEPSVDYELGIENKD